MAGRAVKPFAPTTREVERSTTVLDYSLRHEPDFDFLVPHMIGGWG